MIVSIKSIKKRFMKNKINYKVIYKKQTLNKFKFLEKPKN